MLFGCIQGASAPRLLVSHFVPYTRQAGHCRALGYLIYIFYKISKSMTIETLRMIYYAYFHSIINYDIIAWGGVYNNNLDLLRNLQNRILRIVHKNKFICQDYPLILYFLFYIYRITYRCLVHFCDIQYVCIYTHLYFTLR